jgi:hypothetical protein
MDKVEQAQRQIAQILASLERETGQLVEELSIYSIDVSTCVSTAQQFLRSVRVELKPIPGSTWQI